MKTALIIYEGMADRAVPALDERTPLEAARCSLATGAAVTGRGGMIIPASQEEDNRAEVRLARYMGLSSEEACAMRRGPLETIGADMPVESGRWVFRADFVTLDGSVLTAGAVQRLSLEETEALVAVVRAHWDPDEVALKVIKPGRLSVQCRLDAGQQVPSISPFTAEGGDYRDTLPKNRAYTFVRDFLVRSHEALRDHPVNEVRVDLGENPANALWLWGGGLMPSPCARRPDGAMATQSGMARGLAESLGMPVVHLADPWLEVEGRRAPFKICGLLEVLREYDHVTIYIEAPHGGGRYGSAEGKVWALEVLDHYVLGPILSLLEAHRPFRVLLATDSAVLTATGRAAPDPLPFVLSGEGIEPDGVGHWDETTCASGSLGRVRASKVIGLLRKE